MINNKKAFTLAEVLVTLAIIGIVAALVIPNVVAKYKRKVVEVQLMKSYNTISNAFKLSEVENGSIESWDVDNSSSSDTFFDKYFTPYIKTAEGSSKNVALKDIGYNDGIKSRGSGYFSGTSKLNYVKLSDGSTLFYGGKLVSRSSGGSREIVQYSYMIYYDINGAKGPNTIAQDVFIYEMPKKNGYPLLMLGEYESLSLRNSFLNNNKAIEKNSKDEIMNKCKDKSESTNAEYCGAWIKLNGWKIPEDYPWL